MVRKLNFRTARIYILPSLKRRMPLLSVPPFTQKHQYDCGPAAVRMVLEYYGIRSNYQKMLKSIGKNRREGTSPDDVLKLFSFYGVDASYTEFNTLERLRHLTEKDTPVIVGWFNAGSSKNGNHWSVVTGVNSKYVYVLDPGDGKLHSMPHQEFSNLWFTVNAVLPKTAKDVSASTCIRETVVPLRPTS